MVKPTVAFLKLTSQGFVIFIFHFQTGMEQNA